MTLHVVLAQIVAVVVVLVGLTTLLVAGQLRAVLRRASIRVRQRADAPYLGLLATVLLVNAVARRYGPDVSWIIGWNLTSTIHGFEGAFVAWIQQFASPSATAYFSFVYVYGYVFILVFPLLAYAALEDPVPLRETAVAYSVNYAIGLLCYVLVIAYGPRNLIPDLVEPLLYTSWPQAQLVTTQVNTYENVFPSLHASLSITVLLLAYRTRDRYPRWLPIAGVFAISIAISTMYLGIHWATDVVAGIVLAFVSVLLATRIDLPPIHWETRLPGRLLRWR